MATAQDGAGRGLWGEEGPEGLGTGLGRRGVRKGPREQPHGHLASRRVTQLCRTGPVSHPRPPLECGIYLTARTEEATRLIEAARWGRRI